MGIFGELIEGFKERAGERARKWELEEQKRKEEGKKRKPLRAARTLLNEYTDLSQQMDANFERVRHSGDWRAISAIGDVNQAHRPVPKLSPSLVGEFAGVRLSPRRHSRST